MWNLSGLWRSRAVLAAPPSLFAFIPQAGQEQDAIRRAERHGPEVCVSPSFAERESAQAPVPRKAPGAALRRMLFGLKDREVTFARRGFTESTPAARLRLERVGRSFLAGYNAAVETLDLNATSAACDALEREWRGFAFEGAAMGLHLIDRIWPLGRGRVQRFLAGPGDPHAYMVHVGIGWTLARLRRDLSRELWQFDPLLRWLIVDGYAFHQAYFYPGLYVEQCHVPTALTGYAVRAFDMGMGRALWFVECCDVRRLLARLDTFCRSRHADLWSGVGLASAYAGGAEREALETLRDAAGEHRACLAQGAAFAGKARERAGNPAEHTELACEVYCGMSASEAAQRTDDLLPDVRGDADRVRGRRSPRMALSDMGSFVDTDPPAFEHWRVAIQQSYAGVEVSR